jgi:hypothetical protein
VTHALMEPDTRLERAAQRAQQHLDLHQVHLAQLAAARRRGYERGQLHGLMRGLVLGLLLGSAVVALAITWGLRA